uniref:Glyoxylate reductase/hydroxypyruvate reductase n=1 Tax=Ciona intestinalis TaxID=7719 RepID=F7A7A0_CIOIN|nr:glyoxylate reductase/hydroxypyruvate reductase [Ciona intestinalis]XP_026692965.1 glyoxylate reductase/hydroxypyruvate reductase [Ciona intestinalis]|eukprot:XP_026692964.1 glyoxylate reductase/hydroxypyruvate reductase [Ciona intestinalis]
MPKLDILITRNIPGAALKLLRERFKVDIWPSDEVIPRPTLLSKIKDKDGVLCLLTDQINKEVLDKAGERLRVVSTISVGVDHVDTVECTKRGIKVGNTPDILTAATAELTVGLLISTSRRIVEGTHAARNGDWGAWKLMWMCGPTLDGATVGLFGLGRIGTAVVQRLKAFGVKKFLYNTANKKNNNFEKNLGVQFASFHDLLHESDFIISCCALNKSTAGIFNKNAFEKMKNSSIFINISRGGVVNQEDLYHALSHNIIRGAGIDVTTPEPLPTDHPLFSLKNCVVTPHIGSATEKTRMEMTMLAVQNLICGLDGTEMPAEYKQ